VAESWHTLPGRLRWAIMDHQPPQGRQKGLRLFQRRMDALAAPDTPGTSLSAIQSYLRDDAEPSLRFVQEAARILGLRAEWLAWGEGTPTEEQEALRRETPEQELARVSRSVYQALGVPVETTGGQDRFWGPAVWAPVARQTALRLYQRRPLWELLSEGVTSHPTTGPGADASWTAAVDDTAAAVAAPLVRLGIDAATLTPSNVADYVQAVALALQRVFYQYNPGDDAEGGEHGEA
jgi:hypothetical protein